MARRIFCGMTFPDMILPGRNGVLSQIGIDGLLPSDENLFSADVRVLSVGGLSLWIHFSGNMRQWTARHGRNVMILALPQATNHGLRTQVHEFRQVISRLGRPVATLALRLSSRRPIERS